MPDANEAAVLDSLIAGAASKPGSLPDLVSAPPSWLTEFLDRMKSRFVEPFLKGIKELLKGWFPNFNLPTPDIDGNALSTLATGTIYLLVAVVAALILLAVWKFCAPHVSSRYHAPANRGSSASPRTALERALEEAIAAEDWPRAARLRWRLSLERRAVPSSATPLQFAQRPAQWDAGTVWRIYGAMFGAATGAREMYAELDPLLTTLERTTA